MAAPETTNNVTVRKLTSLMSQLWTKIKTALQGKQDDLGISSSGDADKFLNEKGQWVSPSGYSVKTASSNDSTYGVKFATTAISSANGVTSYGTFYFHRLQVGRGAKTLSAHVNRPITGVVQIFHRRENDGTLTIQGRVTVLQSDFIGEIRLYYAQDGNNVNWYIGTTNSYGFTSWAIQKFESFTSSLCTFTATELSFITSLTGLTENNASYKTPLVDASSPGTGSLTNPVYVDGNGRLAACNDAKYYSASSEIDYNYKTHFFISSGYTGKRTFTIDVTKLQENVAYEFGAVLIFSSGLPGFGFTFKKTSSTYNVYGDRENGINLASGALTPGSSPTYNVKIVRIGTSVYIIGY